MIDWRLAANALGILGLSLALATWSYAYAEARRAGIKVLALLNTRSYAPILDSAAILVLISLALTETRVWARVWWVLCLGLMGWQLVVHLRPPRPANDSDVPG